jgi:hypothetical protein
MKAYDPLNMQLEMAHTRLNLAGAVEGLHLLVA